MSTKISTFKIDKTTSTFADELLAAGFIRILREWYFQQAVRTPDIVQIDHGYAYIITCEPTLVLEAVVENIRPFYPVVLIQTKKNKDKLPAELPPAAYVHYETVRDERSHYFEAYKALDKSAKRAEIIGEDHPALASLPPAPHQDWDIFRMINPAALIGYNGLMAQWATIVEAGLQGAIYTLLCQLFSQSPNPIDAVRDQWRKLAKAQNWKLVDATASQFYNPSQGKGINKIQPDGVGLGNLKSFWLLEWLKAIGLYEIGFTRTMQGAGDRKTYVPIYGRMSPDFAKNVYQRFKTRMRYSETAVRSDILVILRYLQAFLERSEDAQTESEEERRQREMFGEEYIPADFMRGFQVAFYKDLGNAVTTMNISFLNLPSWVKIHESDDVQVYKDILQEHEELISRQLREDRGEELDLLTSYRDFIVADNLDPFFEFTTAYSSWIISQGEKSTFPPRKFSTHNLRRLILSNQPQLSKIVDSPGFINIARAIRESTVRAQYLKNQKNDKRYTIRYGLGRDLVRQSQYPKKFISDLSDFLFAYNAENAQVLERYPKERYPQYKHRWDVQTEDIKDILDLIDKYEDSNLIAKLLVAYGYASEYRARQEEDNHS